jgi:hypothetical protein
MVWSLTTADASATHHVAAFATMVLDLSCNGSVVFLLYSLRVSGRNALGELAPVALDFVGFTCC